LAGRRDFATGMPDLWISWRSLRGAGDLSRSKAPPMILGRGDNGNSSGAQTAASQFSAGANASAVAFAQKVQNRPVRRSTSALVFRLVGGPIPRPRNPPLIVCSAPQYPAQLHASVAFVGCTLLECVRLWLLQFVECGSPLQLLVCPLLAVAWQMPPDARLPGDAGLLRRNGRLAGRRDFATGLPDLWISWRSLWGAGDLSRSKAPPKILGRGDNGNFSGGQTAAS